MAAQSTYNKTVTWKLWTDLLVSKKKFTAWCRLAKINRTEMYLSMQKHFASEWAEKEHLLGTIPTAICGYCGMEFVVNIGKQRFCNSNEARKQWAIDNPEKEKVIRAVILNNAKKAAKR